MCNSQERTECCVVFGGLALGLVVLMTGGLISDRMRHTTEDEEVNVLLLCKLIPRQAQVFERINRQQRNRAADLYESLGYVHSKPCISVWETSTNSDVSDFRDTTGNSIRMHGKELTTSAYEWLLSVATDPENTRKRHIEFCVFELESNKNKEFKGITIIHCNDPSLPPNFRNAVANDPCKLHPCNGRGVCQRMRPSNYTCLCDPPSTGKHCEYNNDYSKPSEETC